MNNKGYTIKELIIVIFMISVFSIVSIAKTSYAFSDNDEIQRENSRVLIKKCATSYAESKNVKELLKKEKKLNITGEDLIKAGYLVDDDKQYSSVKITINYNEEKDVINATVKL